MQAGDVLIWSLFRKAVALMWSLFREVVVVIRHALNFKTRIFMRRPVLDQTSAARGPRRPRGTWGYLGVESCGTDAQANCFCYVDVTVGRWELLLLLQCHSDVS